MALWVEPPFRIWMKLRALLLDKLPVLSRIGARADAQRDHNFVAAYRDGYFFFCAIVAGIDKVFIADQGSSRIEV